MSTPNEQTKRMAVPSFTSFKSKVTASTTSNSQSSRNRRSPDRTESDKARERHRDTDRHHRKRRKHNHGESERRPENSHVTHRPKSPDHKHVSREADRKTENAPTSSLFVLDLKGDALIRKYGGLDRAKVPPYYRHGRGKVLGSQGRLFIHRDGPRDQFSIRMPGEGFGGDRDGLRSRRLRVPSSSITLRKQTKEDSDDEEGSYLAIGSKRSRRKRRDGSQSDDDDGPSYRSIEGKRKIRPGREMDDSSTESEAEEDGPLHSESVLKSAELSRRVKDHPEDIDGWLALVDHQDSLLQATGTMDRQEQASEAQSYTEIKVSMLESALSAASTPEGRGRILVRLMQEGVKVWTSKVATQKWSQVVREEEGNFELWRTHLDFEMSNIAAFQFEDVKVMLLARLHLILRRSKSEPAAYAEVVYVFLRLTRFLHDTGYRELAVAAWQGLLELNFVRPPHEVAVEELRDFWESEAPRIGEDNALGWRRFVESGGAVDPPEPRRVDADELQTRQTERGWESAARMPARMMDQGADDDPFQVVMFSDIEPLLFVIPACDLSAVQDQLFDAFLLFCGLPLAIRSSDWTGMAWNDPFLSVNGDGLAAEPAWDSTQPVEAEQFHKLPRFEKSGVHTRMTLDLLFSRGGWYQYWPVEKPEQLVDTSWALSTIKQLVLTAGLKQLATYYLGMCFWKTPERIKSTAKALLKRYPSNIDLYTGYALCEVNSGRAEVAKLVMSSAMAVATTSPVAKNLDFWKTRTWFDLEAGELASAKRRICSVVDPAHADTDNDVPASVVLKAHQLVSSGFHDSMAARDLGTAGAQGEYLVLMSYLFGENPTEPKSQSQGNISAAMATTGMVRNAFKSRRFETSGALERVLQLASRLLFWNAANGPHRRVYIQERLSEMIDLFPRNTMLTSLFEWTDSSLRIKDETRTLLSERTLQPRSRDCVSSRRFAIMHELSRGNVHSTRAAFEKAVSSDACRNSAVLWTAYARFCSSQRELKREAKDVYYRALRHCPWHKGVMMGAFGRESGLDVGERKSVLNTMAAKGLRIHAEAEEMMG